MHVTLLRVTNEIKYNKNRLSIPGRLIVIRVYDILFFKKQGFSSSAPSVLPFLSHFHYCILHLIGPFLPFFSPSFPIYYRFSESIGRKNQTRVSYETILQPVPTRVSHETNLQLVQTRVPNENSLQPVQTRVSNKTYWQPVHTGV